MTALPKMQKPIEPVGERVVPRRPHEREPSHLDRSDRTPGGEPSRFPGGRLADRVAVEPALLVERGDAGDVVWVVGALDRRPGSRGRPRAPA